MTQADLIVQLRAAGLVGSADVRLSPLIGGVSSEIWLVESAAGRFVVKSALARLRVRDEWFADVSRNGIEQAYLSYAASVVPGAVPQVLASHPASGWFAMEYLGEGFSNWKQSLLHGDASPIPAERAGDVLGRLHRASWGDPMARTQFATLENFHALRIEPYLLTTARRVPEATAVLTAEAERLAGTSLALVHGDYSPKNLLVSADRLIVLDAEVAWFGDPAFDLAFLLNHLLLKSLLHHQHPAPLLELVTVSWSAYGAALGANADAELERRLVRLLLCLMLARVHGKSPVEYLAAKPQEFVTRFVLEHLANPPSTLPDLVRAWRSALVRL